MKRQTDPSAKAMKTVKKNKTKKYIFKQSVLYFGLKTNLPKWLGGSRVPNR